MNEDRHARLSKEEDSIPLQIDDQNCCSTLMGLFSEGDVVWELMPLRQKLPKGEIMLVDGKQKVVYLVYLARLCWQ